MKLSLPTHFVAHTSIAGALHTNLRCISTIAQDDGKIFACGQGENDTHCQSPWITCLKMKKKKLNAGFVQLPNIKKADQQ